MSEGIHKTIFLDLLACDPETVVSRTGCQFDKIRQQYFINIWGHPYCVDLNTDEIRPEGPGLKSFHEYWHLFILYFLMKSKNIPPSGVWVSEKDIPGGAAFFRGPHAIPVEVIANRFGDHIDLFKKACEKSGGIPLELADAAFLFQITQTIPVALLYWQGDAEFSSQAALLFDRTIGQHLPLDIIWALSVAICHTLG